MFGLLGLLCCCLGIIKFPQVVALVRFSVCVACVVLLLWTFEISSASCPHLVCFMCCVVALNSWNFFSQLLTNGLLCYYFGLLKFVLFTALFASVSSVTGRCVVLSLVTLEMFPAKVCHL